MTVFTKIIKGEIPKEFIYKDEDAVAFLDINPLRLGHTLLITKEPYTWMTDVPEELVGKMFIKAKRIMIAIKKALDCDYVEIIVMGKDVPHFHIHLIPRMLIEEARVWDHQKYESTEQEMEYINKIKNNL